MKLEKRIEEIEKELTALNERAYSKVDMVNGLKLLRKQIIEHSFESIDNGGEYHSLYDAVNKWKGLNEKYNNVAGLAMKEFDKGSKHLFDEINAEQSGLDGELYVKHSLETMKTPAIILNNIILEDGAHKSEIDYLVLTSKAIFVIEVKNPHKDIFIDESGNYWRLGQRKELDTRLGEKMNDKIYLVKNALNIEGYMFPKIVPILVFTNSRINVNNEYEYLKHCFLATLPNFIDNYSGEEQYSELTLKTMANIIIGSRKKDYFTPSLDVQAYKRNFATLVASIEMAEEKQKKASTINHKNASTIKHKKVSTILLEHLLEKVEIVELLIKVSILRAERAS